MKQNFITGTITYQELNHVGVLDRSCDRVLVMIKLQHPGIEILNQDKIIEKISMVFHSTGVDYKLVIYQ